MQNDLAHLYPLLAPESGLGSPMRGTVVGTDEWLQVACEGLGPVRCEVLCCGLTLAYEVGDHVLVLPPRSAQDRGVVLGKLTLPGQATAPQQLTLEAGGRLAIRCGASSLEMRADGQVLVSGDDLLLRAKGAHRIRAGTVSIN